MINYEPEKSPFFEANKNYCGRIENTFKTINAECGGFCDSFGYEMETNFKKNDLSFYIKLYKYQVTQNSKMNLMTENAHDDVGAELTIKGLNPNLKLTIGRSSFRRMFSSDEMKKIIPAPYFIQSDNSIILNFESLIEIILSNKISKFKLKNRTLVCKIGAVLDEPLKLISEMEIKIKTLL